MPKQGLDVSLLRDILGCRQCRGSVDGNPGRILVRIAFLEVRVRLRWSEVRSGIPEIVGAQNFPGLMILGQMLSNLVHVACHLTGSVVEVML